MERDPGERTALACAHLSDLQAPALGEALPMSSSRLCMLDDECHGQTGVVVYACWLCGRRVPIAAAIHGRSIILCHS